MRSCRPFPVCPSTPSTGWYSKRSHLQEPSSQSYHLPLRKDDFTVMKYCISESQHLFTPAACVLHTCVVDVLSFNMLLYCWKHFNRGHEHTIDMCSGVNHKGDYNLPDPSCSASACKIIKIALKTAAELFLNAVRAHVVPLTKVAGLLILFLGNLTSEREHNLFYRLHSRRCIKYIFAYEVTWTHHSSERPRSFERPQTQSDLRMKWCKTWAWQGHGQLGW